MITKLKQLCSNGTLKSYDFKSQVPSIIGDNKSRLMDECLLTFPSGETLKISTSCSGCLENTSLDFE